MLIYKINTNSHSEHLDSETKKELSINGFDVVEIESSSMSFITSIRIATACKKMTPDVVVVENTKNAVAAISARELVRKRGNNFMIAIRIRNFDSILKAVPRGFEKEIDLWLFESEKLLELYKSLVVNEKAFIIAQPLKVLHVEQSTTRSTLQADCQLNGVSKIGEVVFVGEFGKCENLARFINALANVEPEDRPHVSVCGTARARYVMPIVKRARSMGLSITWLGANYVIDNVLTNASGFILSDSPFSSHEIKALAMGIPPVTASNIAEWVDPALRKAMSEAAKKTYLSNHDPKVVAKRFAEIIKKIRP